MNAAVLAPHGPQPIGPTFVKTHPRVVLVDGLTETRDVLSAVFESRGVVVERLARTMPADPAPGPDVLVLQEETVPSGWECVPRVVIGRAELPPRTSHVAELPSPFDYADLVSAIESLLDSPPATA